MATKTTTRAAELAAQMETVNQEIIDAAAGCSDEQWQRVTASEEWPVGVLAHHVAEVQHFFIGVLEGLAAGAATWSLTSQDVDENNAAHARQYAGAGKAETLALLRERGATLTKLIAGLDDAELAQAALTIDGQTLNGEQVVELGLVNHFREHLASIRATLES